MDNEARSFAGAASAGDRDELRGLRAALGDGHRLVGACRVWTDLAEHPVVRDWRHPDRRVLWAPSETELGIYDIAPGLHRAIPDEIAAHIELAEALANQKRSLRRLLDRDPTAARRAKIEKIIAQIEEAERLHEEGSGAFTLDPDSELYAAVLVRRLRAYDFTWELQPNGGMPTGPGGNRSTPSMPRERKDVDGRVVPGRTLFAVVVEALAKALNLPYKDSQEKRERIAEALPDVFADLADPGPRGPIARALQNAARR